MSCDRCGECRQRGDRFCMYCGERLDYPTRSGCDRCEECLSEGDTFCKYCGKKLTEDPNPFLVIGLIVGIITAFTLTAVLIFEYIVALWGIPQVLPHLPDYGTVLFLVVPVIVNIVSFNGVLSQIYYILLILAVTVCLGIFIYKAVRPISDLVNGNNKTITKTAFFEVPVLFCVLYIWQFIFLLILRGAGVDIQGLPDRETWIWMYELLEAPVWEEIITRILLIGVPMMLIAVFAKHEGKSSWKYLFGGFGINKTVIVLIFFSAIIFGAGHLNSWGWWKFFPTFAFGLIAGYLFSRYGVYATVIMHFLTDYMSAESWLLGTEGSVITALVVLLLSFACIPYTYIYVKRGVLALRDVFTAQNNDLR